MPRRNRNTRSRRTRITPEPPEPSQAVQLERWARLLVRSGRCSSQILERPHLLTPRDSA